MKMFFLGLCATALITWYVWWNARREYLRLDEEKQRLQDERKIVVDFMHQLAESLASGVDREALLRTIVHAGVVSTGALSACLFLRSGNRLRGAAVEGLFPPHRRLPPELRNSSAGRARFIEQVLRSETFEVGEGLVGAVAASGKGILIAQAESDPRVVEHDDPALKVRSAIVVPISFRDRNLAVLAIVNRSDGLPFGESDFSLAVSLGEQAGLALQNFELMAFQLEKTRLENDLVLARNIQGMLLPKKFPEHPQLSFAAIYESAQQVGGDLYDVFPLKDGRIGLAIADVSGKGIPASLVMAICQSNLRHFARRYGAPAKVLTKLNEVLAVETSGEMFVTVIYAVLDPAHDSLTFARAGHELPLLCSANGGEGGRSQFVRSEGMAVGMVPGELFEPAIEDVTIPFAAGDSLILFTDGVTEALNTRQEEFSNDRLAEIAREACHRSPSEINSAIRQHVTRFCGGNAPSDDFTLVTVKRRC